MSQKAKVDKPSKARVNKYGFLALWIGSQVLGWLTFFLINDFVFSFYNAIWVGLIAGLSIGIPTALGQKLGLYLYFGRWFRTWTRANILAWVIGGISITWLSQEFNLNGNERLGILIQVLSLMLPPTAAQLWVLRKQVKNIWLWLLAAIAASSVFGAVFGQLGASNLSAFPAFGLYSLVTGLSLLWMMGMQKDENKLKKDVDMSHLEDGTAADVAEADDVELERLANRK